MDTQPKIYKVLTPDELREIDPQLISYPNPQEARMNIDGTKVILRFVDECVDCLTNDEIIEYINLNWDEWNYE